MTTSAPATPNPSPTPNPALTLTAEQSAQLLDLLGLPADTTDPTLILATVADLVAQAEGADCANPTQANAVAAAKRLGLEVLEPDVLASLRRDAAECRTLKAAVERQRVEAAVDAALRQGKITAARRSHWVTLIEADPAMADVLAGLPDELALPLAPIGHGVDAEGGAPVTGWLFD